VWGQVRDQVGSQVASQVRLHAGRQVWDQVWGEIIWERVPFAFWQHDPGWLSWCDNWRRAGVPGVGGADGLIAVGRNAGWWWPLHGSVVLTERPRHVHLDHAGRLHGEHGPAILYPDGFGVWAWHGLRVAREVIEEPVRVEQIERERNVEIRRVLTERYGLERYLRESRATLCTKRPQAPATAGEKLRQLILALAPACHHETLAAAVLEGQSAGRCRVTRCAWWVRCPATCRIPSLLEPPIRARKRTNRPVTIGRKWGQIKPSHWGQFRPSFPRAG